MLSSGALPVVLTGAAPPARGPVDVGVLNAAGTILPILNISFTVYLRDAGQMVIMKIRDRKAQRINFK